MAIAREDAGYTQQEMAAKFGLKHAAIAKWENDRAQPRDLMWVLEMWSQITDVPVWWLLGLDEPPAPKRGRLGGTRPGGTTTAARHTGTHRGSRAA